jgi:hypothetical protein
MCDVGNKGLFADLATMNVSGIQQGSIKTIGYTEPEKDLLLLLRQLQIQLPAQPPPKIKARNNREVA